MLQLADQLVVGDFLALFSLARYVVSDSRIRPASLSSSEANSKSSLPTCSQVKSSDWEEA